MLREEKIAESALWMGQLARRREPKLAVNGLVTKVTS